jgi:AmmeMemoRadiSam system protein A
MEKEHPLVALARRTIDEYVRHGRMIFPPSDEEMTEEMKRRAGVFVSLKKRGQLRGCIGTFLPSTENVAREVIRNAVAAATQDPRFPPVRAEELEDIDISVDVLSEPEPVKDSGELDPKRYGVIVESGWKKGLLLPDLEGVNTVEQQLSIAMAKAGIKSGEPVKLYRFFVERYK